MNTEKNTPPPICTPVPVPVWHRKQIEWYEHREDWKTGRFPNSTRQTPGASLISKQTTTMDIGKRGYLLANLGG